MKYRGIIMRAAKIVAKCVGGLLIVTLLAVVVTSISPIYNFGEPKPFSGNDIYNPYRDVAFDMQWARANFHTHTRVEGILNECEYSPAETLTEYARYGYNVVTFSNHNLLTTHPEPELQVNVYEHGYNILKYHKLVFGSEKVAHFDHLLPIFASQKQWQIALLGAQSDIVQLNHPLRTPTLDSEQLVKLRGYNLIELDSGKSTDNSYWDSALSAGHYVLGTAGDDLHKPNRSNAIAIRCTMLSTPLTLHSELLNTQTATYPELLATLRSGGYYAMRLPDYGNGDIKTKALKNSSIPHITAIGVEQDDIYIALSEAADSIRFTADGGRCVALFTNQHEARHRVKDEDSYVRITAFMTDGEVIYSNPFARYDATMADSPYDGTLPEISIPRTILFNAALLLLTILLVAALRKLFRL